MVGLRRCEQRERTCWLAKLAFEEYWITPMQGKKQTEKK